MQALYQWQISGHEIDELLSQYVEDENWEKTDKDYFTDLVSESITRRDALSEQFNPHLNLSNEQIDPVENAIMLIATYEIMHKHETPSKVILSEAINLCKKFGSTDGYKFINGVLDKVAKIRNTSDSAVS